MNIIKYIVDKYYEHKLRKMEHLEKMTCQHKWEVTGASPVVDKRGIEVGLTMVLECIKCGDVGFRSVSADEALRRR